MSLSGPSTATALLVVLIAIVLSVTAQNGAPSDDEVRSTDSTDPSTVTAPTSDAPKIRIVVQHLILSEEDYRRRAGPIAVVGGADTGTGDDSRQESTLEVFTDMPNSAIVLDEKLYQESVVHLECAAPYPVEWVYKGEGYPDPVLTFLERKRNSANYSDPSTYTYSSKLDLITLSERNTGRYTCRGVGVGATAADNDPKEAYFHIYVPGKSVFVTAQPAVKSEATPPSIDGEEFTLLIPCTVSNPNTTLNLYKIDKRSSYLHEIRGAAYDPSTGFTIKSFTPWGIYVCITTDKKRLMMATSKPDRKMPAGSPEVRTSFTYDADRDAFLCCANSSVTREGLRPQMRYVACSSEPECQIRKHGPGQRYPEADPFTTFGKDRVCAIMLANVARRSSAPIGSPVPNYRTLLSTRDKGPSGPSGGMFQCRIGARIDDYYFAWTKTKPDGEPVLGTVNAEDYYKFLELVLKISSTRSTSVADGVQVPLGSLVRVECNYNSFLFTKGHVWMFGFQNGTSAVVEREHVATNHFYAEPQGDDDSVDGDEGGLREFTTIAFPDTNITSLICSVPVAARALTPSARGEWRNVSTPITITVTEAIFDQ